MTRYHTQKTFSDLVLESLDALGADTWSYRLKLRRFLDKWETDFRKHAERNNLNFGTQMAAFSKDLADVWEAFDEQCGKGKKLGRLLQQIERFPERQVLSSRISEIRTLMIEHHIILGLTEESKKALEVLDSLTQQRIDAKQLKRYREDTQRRGPKGSSDVLAIVLALDTLDAYVPARRLCGLVSDLLAVRRNIQTSPSARAKEVAAIRTALLQSRGIF